MVEKFYYIVIIIDFKSYFLPDFKKIMPKLTPNSPLYSFPLPEIENWLKQMGCEQNLQQLNYWYIKKMDWEAQINLDVEDLNVNYIKAGADGSDIKRSFRYSLSRQDIEDAVFSGP